MQPPSMKEHQRDTIRLQDPGLDGRYVSHMNLIHARPSRKVLEPIGPSPFWLVAE